MKLSKFVLTAGAMAASAALLTACGGGGGGSSGGGGGGGGGGGLSLAGGFSGTTSDNLAFDMLVMDDGKYWVFYGDPPSNGALQSAGFVEGSSTIDTTAQSFSSSDGYDFGQGVALSAVGGTYTSTAITGTLTYPTGKSTFSGAPITASVYNYAAAPNLAYLNGTWDMGSLVGSGTTITVATDANGTTFRGVNGASCNFTGTFTADASGKNVYDVDIKFQGTPCAQNSDEYQGVAIMTKVGGSAQLMLAATDVATHTLGITSTGVVASNGGGGGGGGQSAAGAYSGSIADTAGHQFDMLVLDDGSYWVVYGRTTNTGLSVAGFIEGTSTQDTTAQTFASSDAVDFGFNPAATATVSGTYTSSAITGEIFYDAGNQPKFTGAPISRGNYDYFATPDPSQLYNNGVPWNMASFAGRGSLITVAADGTFVGVNSAGCNFTGRFTLDASGKNVYDSDITFGGGVCPQGTDEYQGIAIVISPLTSPQLVMTGIDVATHTLGLAASGH